MPKEEPVASADVQSDNSASETRHKRRQSAGPGLAKFGAFLGGFARAGGVSGIGGLGGYSGLVNAVGNGIAAAAKVSYGDGPGSDAMMEIHKANYGEQAPEAEEPTPRPGHHRSGSSRPRPKPPQPEPDEPVVENTAPVNDKWAIVVGVSKFKDSSIPSLHYADKDARDFAKFLVDKQNFAPDHVRLLTNEKATQREIVNEIAGNFLPRVVKPNDLVLIYYSSHGSPAERDSGMENFLVCYDTDKTNLFGSAIDVQDLCRVIRERAYAPSGGKGTERILVIMDACHSGGGADGAKDADDGNFDAKNIRIGSGQLLVSSSSAAQKSWESKRYKNGVFTKNLMDALSSPSTDILKAVDTLKAGVAEEVQQDFGVKQTVQVNSGKWTGSKLVLAVKPAAPKPLPEHVKELLPPDSKSGGTNVAKH